MSLARFLADPFADVFDTRMSSFDPFQGEKGGMMSQWRPKVDVKETDNAIVLCAELPGVPRDQINIEVDNGVLTISGEKQQEKKEESEKYHRVERSYGKFSRSMSLPEGVTAEQIQATYNHGLLEVTLPKLQKKDKTGAKRINIK
jgi:HSP20 family protein